MAARRRIIEQDVDVADDAEVVDRSIARAPWSPAQAVALIVGGLFAVLGAVTLARTGINFSNVSGTHTTVAGLDQTALLGLIEFIVGMALIGAGSIPGGGRSSMSFFGVVLLGFGVVLLAFDSNGAAVRRFTSDDGAGWLFVVTGIVLLVAAMASPVIFANDRRRVARRSAMVEH